MKLFKPKTKTFLPFHRPSLGKAEEREILDTLRSGWITTGPKTIEFEKRFARYIGCKHAIALNSCTAGLHLALVALGIGEGDEVITSPITFPATANVIIHQKARPVFVDVEPDTLNIDPDKIEASITPRTKAIIPIHFAGHPCDMDRILSIAKRYNLAIIEDAAHAIEAKYHQQKIGTIGNFTSFSFYATKNITTGEGGMLTTNNDEFADKIRILRLHGISKDAWKRYGSEGYKHWDVIYPGYKYNMFDIQAALGLHQLKKIERFWKIRKTYVEMYDDAFKSIPEIILLSRRPHIKHSYHLYVILVKNEDLKVDRDTIMNLIQSEGVGIGIHFRSLHLHPFYRRTFHFKRGDFPNAAYASERVISLPLYPALQEKDVRRVIKVVKKVISQSR